MFSFLIENSKILIVDDEEITRTYLGALLKSKRFNIFLASNGKQAIDICIDKIPDLILLDVTLPDISGIEVCTQLKSDSKTKDIPVIFITGKTETGDIVRGFEVGAVDYITKPFNMEELLARVFSHLQIIKMQEQLLKNQELIHLKEMELLQNEKKHIVTELEQAKKEAISISMRISKAGSLIIDMTKKISAEIKNPRHDTVARIAAIIHNFNILREKENWDEIETRFLKVHHDFFGKLLKSFPDLTKNELKLCAFLRLNLSTKEIAAITLQSEEAIKKSRYRLRQKLNAPSEANLSGLILQL